MSFHRIVRARSAWLLAACAAIVAVLVSLPTPAWAQPASNIAPCERVPFAAFYAASVEGISQDGLTACLSGASQPTNRVFTAWADVPRLLRHLEHIDRRLAPGVTRESLPTPGEVALTNYSALIARCELVEETPDGGADADAGDAVDADVDTDADTRTPRPPRHRVRLSRSAMEHRPWDPGSWFPRDCVDRRSIEIRPAEATMVTRIIRGSAFVRDATDRLTRGDVASFADARTMASGVYDAMNDGDTASCEEGRAFVRAYLPVVARLPDPPSPSTVPSGENDAARQAMVRDLRDQAETINDLRRMFHAADARAKAKSETLDILYAIDAAVLLVLIVLAVWLTHYVKQLLDRQYDRGMEHGMERVFVGVAVRGHFQAEGYMRVMAMSVAKSLMQDLATCYKREIAALRAEVERWRPRFGPAVIFDVDAEGVVVCSGDPGTVDQTAFIVPPTPRVPWNLEPVDQPPAAAHERSSAAAPPDTEPFDANAALDFVHSVLSYVPAPECPDWYIALHPNQRVAVAASALPNLLRHPADEQRHATAKYELAERRDAWKHVAEETVHVLTDLAREIEHLLPPDQRPQGERGAADMGRSALQAIPTVMAEAARAGSYRALLYQLSWKAIHALPKGDPRRSTPLTVMDAGRLALEVIDEVFQRMQDRMIELLIARRHEDSQIIEGLEEGIRALARAVARYLPISAADTRRALEDPFAEPMELLRLVVAAVASIDGEREWNGARLDEEETRARFFDEQLTSVWALLTKLWATPAEQRHAEEVEAWRTGFHVLHRRLESIGLTALPATSTPPSMPRLPSGRTTMKLRGAAMPLLKRPVPRMTLPYVHTDRGDEPAGQ